jgi:alkaline phosphatase D
LLHAVCYAQSGTSLNELIINFGSCNKQHEPQPLWDDIINNHPDVWVWLGDNIYGDTDNMEILKEKYEKQNKIKEYEVLCNNSKVIGTWDDHDFGLNDGNKNYHFKEKSKQLFFDFFREPVNSSKRKNKGVYSSHIFNLNKDFLIKIILLDVRYNQDEIKRVNGIYQPNYNGDILGEEQWGWLENELKDNNAALTILGSGLQIIPADHKDEKWANFPVSRQRLFNLLETNKISNVIFLSGDRHMAEISKIKLDRLDNEIYEITSSGMTHSWEVLKEDYNRYRVGSIIPHLNYGQLKIIPKNYTINVVMSLNGDKGKEYWSKTLQFPITKYK